MRIVIIEDEPLAAELLSGQILRILPNAIITTQIDSIEAAVLWFNENQHPDLIFMDIQLADGISFEIFKHISLHIPVIFTTAYDQFTLQAFKVNSIDYLLKPILSDDLQKAIDKYITLQKTGIQMNLAQIDLLLASKREVETRIKDRFLLRKGDRLVPVETAHITYIVSQDKTTLCVTSDGQQYFMEYTLDGVSDILDRNIFFRANRKYLITRSALKDIRLHLNGKIKITLNACADSDIFVSRERAGDFRKWLGG